MLTLPFNEMATACQINFVIFFTTIPFCVSVARTHSHVRNEENHTFNGVHKNVIQKWEFELDDKLDYPRGDTDKLNSISELWSKYYECSKRLNLSLTAKGRLPSVYQTAYERAVINLPCGLCVAPDQATAIKWLYSQSVRGPFSSLEYNKRVVESKGNLVVYDLRMDDAGAYRCTLGQSSSGLIVLDVVDKNEPYDLVKPYTSRGPYPTQSQHFKHNEVSLITSPSWTAWSECSSCVTVGRRRKYGMCYIKLNSDEGNNKIYVPLQSVNDETDSKTTNILFNIFQDFPGGIPCRSRLLPIQLRRLPVLAQRRNQIMIGLCKVPCDKGSVYEVRTLSGCLLERANNTEGVYSLSQRLPLEPPVPVSETVFAAIGDKLTMFCPGDIPVNWRVGSKKLVPRDADKSSDGRVHLNARDGLVFSEITFGDSNLYSCWQRDALVGAVKLRVWDAQPYWSHALLPATLAAACALLRAADSALRNKRRRVVA